jgi:YVTN family beta-propeller protein
MLAGVTAPLPGDSMLFNFVRPRVLATTALLATGAASLSAQQPYKIVDQWKIGGTGAWDYLLADSAAHRLYVTHGPRVEVVDTQTGKVIGAITGLKGTHGVALDAAGRYGYISDGQANDVVVFDRQTLAMIDTVPAGTNPDGIAYEPVTKTVWAFNGRSGDVTVIDTETRKAVATIKLPGKPEFPQADGEGNVFDNIEDKNLIVRLNATSKTITATWNLDACDSPSGLAIDRANHRLFSVCDGKKMAVTDYHTGKLLASPQLGNGPDAAGYSPSHNLAFSSNGEGTLTVVDAAHDYSVLQSLATRRGARTMSYDDGADRVYLVTAEFGPAPAATPENPHPRPAIVPDSFTILVVGRN